MKRGCVAFVLAMIGFACIGVFLYQGMKWSASPAVLTPRAATAEAMFPTCTLSNAHWKAVTQEAEPLATMQAWEPEPLFTEATRTGVWDAIDAEKGQGAGP